jgi:hypothetical protein
MRICGGENKAHLDRYLPIHLGYGLDNRRSCIVLPLFVHVDEGAQLLLDACSAQGDCIWVLFHEGFVDCEFLSDALAFDGIVDLEDRIVVNRFHL